MHPVEEGCIASTGPVNLERISWLLSQQLHQLNAVSVFFKLQNLFKTVILLHNMYRY